MPAPPQPARLSRLQVPRHARRMLQQPVLALHMQPCHRCQKGTAVDRPQLRRQASQCGGRRRRRRLSVPPQLRIQELLAPRRPRALRQHAPAVTHAVCCCLVRPVAVCKGVVAMLGSLRRHGGRRQGRWAPGRGHSRAACWAEFQAA